METRCLICESTLIITKAQAQACSLLLGTLGGFLRGFTQTRDQLNEHMNDRAGVNVQAGLELVAGGVDGATSGCAQSWEFAQDVQRYHFGDFDCLCLRCGARFDQQPSAALMPQPGDLPAVQPTPGSTGDQSILP